MKGINYFGWTMRFFFFSITNFDAVQSETCYFEVGMLITPGELSGTIAPLTPFVLMHSCLNTEFGYAIFHSFQPVTLISVNLVCHRRHFGPAKALQMHEQNLTHNFQTSE